MDSKSFHGVVDVLVLMYERGILHSENKKDKRVYINFTHTRDTKRKERLSYTLCFCFCNTFQRNKDD